MAGAVILIGYEPVKKVLDLNGIFSRALAASAVPGLRLLGVDASSKDTTIYVPGYALQILFGCNGLEAFIIYGAAVLSFPANWKLKISGIVIGLLALQILNYIRIVLLGLVGVYLPEHFEIFHLYVAQGVMIAAALLTFIAWINYVARH